MYEPRYIVEKTHLEPLRVRRQDVELQVRRHDRNEDHAAQPVVGFIPASAVEAAVRQVQIVILRFNQLSLSPCDALFAPEASSGGGGKVKKKK